MLSRRRSKRRCCRSPSRRHTRFGGSRRSVSRRPVVAARFQSLRGPASADQAAEWEPPLGDPASTEHGEDKEEYSRRGLRLRARASSSLALTRIDPRSDLFHCCSFAAPGLHPSHRRPRGPPAHLETAAKAERSGGRARSHQLTGPLAPLGRGDGIACGLVSPAHHDLGSK